MDHSRLYTTVDIFANNNNDGDGTINYVYQYYQDLLDTLRIPILPKKGHQ